ncbi:sialidase family protein [Gaoshiqia sediminis]|uniref:Exo-alpha-sialidase n=1 Tax=Gaoshiqia sediminis TaxID=2986998 RepID=A0AA41Y4Q2_9BACT|nr:sialidase family protein [Gaoshiqia sediminis]MCW0481869.1 exo-alpha-sialidase [Gaoshiqia sediminis]
MMRLANVFLLIFVAGWQLFLQSCTAERNWKEGIVSSEFIYEEAPFPSCHAATIAETTDGTLVASWFGGTHERHPDVCIYVSRLVDGQWSEPVNAADGVQDDGSRMPTWNPVLYQVPDGELQLYYKIGPNPREWQGWMKTSPDGGKSWSEAIMLPEGYMGPVKNKPELIGETLICPTSTEHEGWKVHFEMTHDFGKTWERTGPINDGVDIHAIQPSILKHGDGRLQVLCRSKNRAVLSSWSDDDGKTWSEMEKTSLPNNNSGTDAVSLTDGTHLLVYNHVLPPGDAYKGVRTPLNVALTKDGTNWLAALVLEDAPDSEFSYPAIIQTKDGLIHIVYTWNRTKIKHVVVDPEKLKLIKMENGEWPL